MSRNGGSASGSPTTACAVLSQARDDQGRLRAFGAWIAVTRHNRNAPEKVLREVRVESPGWCKLHPKSDDHASDRRGLTSGFLVT
ncbi:hypothetical protein GCM10022248_17020 [Nonomuraea soli]